MHSPSQSRGVKRRFDWRELPAPGGPDSLVGAFVGVSGDALIFAGGQFRVEGNFSDHIYVLTDPAGPWNCWTRVFRGHWPAAYR